MFGGIPFGGTEFTGLQFTAGQFIMTVYHALTSGVSGFLRYTRRIS